MSHRILAVDLGTALGWAVLINGSLVELGTKNLKNKTTEKLLDPERRLRQYQFLLTKIILYKITHIAVELVNPGTMKGNRQRTLYYGALGVIELMAARENLPLIYVPVQQVKLQMTGRGNASKDMMLRAAERRSSIKVDGPDAADAFGVGLAAIENLKKEKENAIRSVHGGRGLAGSSKRNSGARKATIPRSAGQRKSRGQSVFDPQ